MKSHVSSCVPAAKNIRSDSRVLLEINISHASPVLLLPQLERWVKMLGASICRRQASVDWAPFTRLLIRNNMTGWLFYERANSSDHDSIFCDGNNLLTKGAGKRLWMLNSFTYYNVNPFKNVVRAQLKRKPIERIYGFTQLCTESRFPVTTQLS